MNNKRTAGEKAVEWIREEMTIGLGTGSTVYYTVLKLGELVKEGLKIRVIPTSSHTEKLARQLGIPLTTFSEINHLDLTIDGADAVTPQLDLVKGGGGALFREKLVATASKMFIVVVDDSKTVDNFNGLSIPIEVLPFGWEVTRCRIERLGGSTTIRRQDDEIYVTDNMNFILDTVFDDVPHPQQLHSELKLMTGIVETGLFPQMADAVVVSSDEKTVIHQRR